MLLKLDIQIGYDFDQSLANSKDEPKGQKRWNQDIDDSGSYIVNHDMEDDVPGHWIGTNNNNLLDLVA